MCVHMKGNWMKGILWILFFLAILKFIIIVVKETESYVTQVGLKLAV